MPEESTNDHAQSSADSSKDVGEEAAKAPPPDDEAASASEDKDMALSDLTEAERFITFTDAVVAIAQTLLILPLMEAAADIPEVESEEGDAKITVGEYFQSNKHEVGSFFISFWVVSIFWVWHDKLFRYVGRFSRLLLRLNFLWMLGIVFLPVATSLLTATPGDDKLGVVVYIGTMLFTTLIGGVMVHVVRRDSRTWKGDKGPGRLAVIANHTHTFLLLVALLISIFAPPAGAYSLIILVLAPLVVNLVEKKWAELR